EARTLTGHRAPVVAVAFSPDGKFLASGDEQVFKLWNAQTLDEIRTVATPAWQLAFTPDSQGLWASMTTDRYRTVPLFSRWPVEKNDPLPSLAVETSTVPDCVRPLWSRDGSDLFLARSGKSSFIQVIETATGQYRFPGPGHDGPLFA